MNDPQTVFIFFILVGASGTSGNVVCDDNACAMPAK